jgi:hypothetical protein
LTPFDSYAAYFRDIVNRVVNGIFGPHCQHILYRNLIEILTDFGYIMPDLLYVLIDIIFILLYSAEFFRDFFSLVVNRKFGPHAHTKKDIHRTCEDPMDIWGYMIKSNT